MNTVILLLCTAVPVLAASMFFISDYRSARRPDQDHSDSTGSE